MPSIHVNYTWCIAVLVWTGYVLAKWGFANGTCFTCVPYVLIWWKLYHMIPSGNLTWPLSYSPCSIDIWTYMNYEWPLANLLVSPRVWAVGAQAGALVRRAWGAASPWMILKGFMVLYSRLKHQEWRFIYLVGGLEPWDCMTFLWLSIQLGMSSSQLTNEHIFQRGRYTTNQI